MLNPITDTSTFCYAGEAAGSVQVPLFGPGPIVMDFAADQKLLGIEINQFSKLIPHDVIALLLKAHE